MTVSRPGYNKVIVLINVLVIVSGCIFSAEKTEKKVTLPDILSISITEGQIIKSRDITVKWKGNSLVEEYRYTIDGIGYSWVDTTSAVFTDLDEKEHIFTLQARKDTLYSSVDSVTFYIDAIQGPGILLSPRKVTGRSFVTLTLEDVSELMAAHIEIYCDDSSALLTDFKKTDSFLEEGDIIVFAKEIDSNRINIDIGFAGMPRGANGRIDIGQFLVRSQTESGVVEIDTLKTVFRNIGNDPVQINGFDMVRVEK